MVTSAMLARQITHPSAPNRANSFPPTLLRTLQLSCRPFFRPRPLFSIACSLFAQNTRGGGTPQHRLLPSRHSDVQTLRPADAISFALCFHNDTNPSSHNSFLFTSMQIPRGCGGAAILRSGLRVSVAVRLRSTQSVEQYIEVTKHRQKGRVMNPNTIGNYALHHRRMAPPTMAIVSTPDPLSVRSSYPGS